MENLVFPPLANTSTRSQRRGLRMHVDTEAAETRCPHCDLFCSIALRPQKPYRLLETGGPGRPPGLSPSSNLSLSLFSIALRPQRPYRLLETGGPGRPPGLSHSSNLSLSLVSIALRPQRPYGLLGTGNPGQPPRLSHSSWAPISLQCCLTSTETVRCVRDGEPRTATSTFTQLLSSDLSPSLFSVA